MMVELKESMFTFQKAAPELIHNEILNYCGSDLFDKILQFLRKIWMMGEISQEWVTALIILLPKLRKDPSKMGSYFPLALTFCLGQLMDQTAIIRLK